MTGCLKIKNDTYYAVLNLKVGDKYKQKWISTKLKTKGNKRKATEFLNALIVEYEEKEIQTKAIEENENQCDILFTEYMKNWLEKKKNKVETITFEGYKTQVNSHIIPYFQEKNFKISEIRPKHISEFYEFKFNSGRYDGRGLSSRSIRMLSFIIKSVFNEAIFNELISKNPSIGVPIPQKNEEKKAIFLDAEKANKVLQFFRGNKLQPLIYMTLYYGLRRSEVLGLKWSAIDLKNDIVDISHTVVENLTIVAKDKTKTAAGKRKYILLPEIKELLLKVKSEQKAYKKAFGKEYQNNNDYIFKWPDGKPYRPDYITKEFQKVLAKNNFPKMRFHDLRHSCASVLYDKGWQLKDIQAWLGHADIQTTANVYTHISNSRKNDMAIDIQHNFSL